MRGKKGLTGVKRVDREVEMNVMVKGDADIFLQTSMMIVDDAISEVPIRPDVFMNVAVPSSLPYYNTGGGGHTNK